MSQSERDDDEAKEQAIIEAAAKEPGAEIDWKSFLAGGSLLPVNPGLTYATGGNILPSGVIGSPWYQQTYNFSLNPPQTPAPTLKPHVLPVEQSTKIIVGYRIWPLSRSYPEGYRIQAANDHFDGTVTPNQRLEAECKSLRYRDIYGSPWINAGPSDERPAKPKHQAPDKDCTCGIYAYKRSVPLEPSEKPYVAGEVNMWGRVIEHADGYRAQFAYPKRLFVVDGGPRAQHIAVALGLAYGVPCEVWEG